MVEIEKCAKNQQNALIAVCVNLTGAVKNVNMVATVVGKCLRDCHLDKSGKHNENIYILLSIYFTQ